MIFIDALATYLTAWLSAFTSQGRRLSPLTPRRLLFLVLAPLGLMLMLVHWFALALDHLLFPAFRRLSIGDAVFVLGVPRSGTTYLHRKLAASPEFTTTQTWEVLLAPAITERRLLQALGKLDAWAGGWGNKGLRYLVGRLSTDLQDVHEVGLDAEEEDYLALLASAGCFFAFLAFPQSARLRALGRLDTLPTTRRERLLDHYHGLLQRHLYAHKAERLLSKNAAFASWMPYLLGRYPDAKFVVCIRQPATALSSQLSSLAGARSSFASMGEDALLASEFSAFYEDWYQTLENTVNEAEGSCMIVDQSALRDRESAVLAGLYRFLQLSGRPPESSPVQKSPALGARHKHDLATWPLASDALKSMEVSFESLRERTRGDLTPREMPRRGMAL